MCNNTHRSSPSEIKEMAPPPFLSFYCKYYSQSIVVFLGSNAHIGSKLLTDYYLTGYQVLGIVYIDQLSGARHAHISHHYIWISLVKLKELYPVQSNTHRQLSILKAVYFILLYFN